MDKLAGIYKITNKQNSKIYIGESENIPRRWIEHITDLICGEHYNSKLQTDFNIYGIKNFKFDVLETYRINENDKNNSRFKLKMTLLCREHVYIHHFDSINNGYNIIDSLNETLINNIGIFNRNEKAPEREQRMIHNFMEDNPDILKLEWNKNTEVIKKKRHKHKTKVKQNEVFNSKEINYKQENLNISNTKIESIELKASKTNYSNFTKLYQQCILDGLITDYVSLNMFKRILQKYNIIYFKDHSWRSTQNSIDKGYIILGKEKLNKCNITYNELYTTELCKNEVYKILKSIDIDQIVVEISNQPFYS